MHKTSLEIPQEIDRLLDDHTYDEIATILNDCGLLTRIGNPYGPVKAAQINDRREYLYERPVVRGGRL
jgi:hypothetical protein